MIIEALQKTITSHEATIETLNERERRRTVRINKRKQEKEIKQ
jgi:hypothetical protein